MVLSLKFENLRLYGTGALLCIGDSTAELVIHHHLISTACSKFKCYVIRVALLSCNLEDGLEMMAMFEPCPACTVRQLSQNNQTVCRYHQMAEENGIVW